jgi:hypothetical protein
MTDDTLAPLVGEWTLQAFGTTGTVTFEWALGERFLLERSSAPDPVPDGLMVIAPDEPTGAYRQHYFDSRGVIRVYKMTIANGVWTLLRDEPDFSPLEFRQRYTGRFSDDGGTIEGCWERSDDGEAWELDFDLVYERVR